MEPLLIEQIDKLHRSTPHNQKPQIKMNLQKRVVWFLSVTVSYTNLRLDYTNLRLNIQQLTIRLHYPFLFFNISEGTVKKVSRTNSPPPCCPSIKLIPMTVSHITHVQYKLLNHVTVDEKKIFSKVWLWIDRINQQLSYEHYYYLFICQYKVNFCKGKGS